MKLKKIDKTDKHLVAISKKMFEIRKALGYATEYQRAEGFIGEYKSTKGIIKMALKDKEGEWTECGGFRYTKLKKGVKITPSWSWVIK